MLVNKEIQDRLGDGRIAPAQLPMYIQTVCIVLGKDGRVEINDEDERP